MTSQPCWTKPSSLIASKFHSGKVFATLVVSVNETEKPSWWKEWPGALSRRLKWGTSYECAKTYMYSWKCFSQINSSCCSSIRGTARSNQVPLLWRNLHQINSVRLILQLGVKPNLESWLAGKLDQSLTDCSWRAFLKKNAVRTIWTWANLEGPCSHLDQRQRKWRISTIAELTLLVIWDLTYRIVPTIRLAKIKTVLVKRPTNLL